MKDAFLIITVRDPIRHKLQYQVTRASHKLPDVDFIDCISDRSTDVDEVALELGFVLSMIFRKLSPRSRICCGVTSEHRLHITGFHIGQASTKVGEAISMIVFFLKNSTTFGMEVIPLHTI